MRVRVVIATLSLLALAVAGCPGQGATNGRPSAADEPRHAPGSKTPSAAAEASAHAGPGVEAAPLPDGLVLAAEPGRDGVALVIQNRSERVVELALDASVERVGGVSGAAGPAASGVPEGLRLDCAETAARCLSLVPGAELRPTPWPAAQAQPQCGSGAREAAPPGRYRFAVRACNSAGPAAARVSKPFELP